jgi:hypothetical protein
LEATPLPWELDASKNVAERWKDNLRRTIRFLSKNPFVGRERKDLEFSGIRSWASKVSGVGSSFTKYAAKGLFFTGSFPAQ